MKKSVILSSAACCAALFFTGIPANAQRTVVVEETDVTVTEVPCETRYYTDSHDNWFLQFGAGIAVPMMENKVKGSDHKHHITVGYNVAFGRWFSPYLGWRMSFLGGPLHWENNEFEKAKYVSANLDFMWDMFNSLGGVNSKRVFSIVPFVGLGGTYVWDFKPNNGNIVDSDGRIKGNSWTLPISAGLQLRFRLCKYVDFFAEGRAQFYGDNFNNFAFGRPIDVNLTVNGGLTVTFGGRDYRSYNPCDYLSYINNLNNQVNDLRGALATTAAALAEAESQLPCPEVIETTIVEAAPAPLMATVRFKINSARISDQEMVNVYNISQWMAENPGQSVAIVGYADKNTGTSEYNMNLSKRRAQAVYDTLVNKYGVNPDRLAIQAEGSEVQPYDVNNWNRIVIFNVAE